MFFMKNYLLNKPVLSRISHWCAPEFHPRSASLATRKSKRMSCARAKKIFNFIPAQAIWLRRLWTFGDPWHLSPLCQWYDPPKDFQEVVRLCFSISFNAIIYLWSWHHDFNSEPNVKPVGISLFANFLKDQVLGLKWHFLISNPQLKKKLNHYLPLSFWYSINCHLSFCIRIDLNQNFKSCQNG